MIEPGSRLDEKTAVIRFGCCDRIYAVPSGIDPERQLRSDARTVQIGRCDLRQAVAGEERSGADDQAVARRLGQAGARRSEEHTSELQSLMRISYAVFCLKKKKKAQENS